MGGCWQARRKWEMFSIWTKGMVDSLKRTPGGAARLMSLQVRGTLAEVLGVKPERSFLLAKGNAILQRFENVPSCQALSEYAFNPCPYSVRCFGGVFGQADVPHVSVQGRD